MTLAGEVSLFNLIDDPDALPAHYAKELRALAAESPGRRRAGGSGRPVEAAHWKEVAERAPQDRLQVPIAGVSHWRREPEFVAAQAARVST